MQISPKVCPFLPSVFPHWSFPCVPGRKISPEHRGISSQTEIQVPLGPASWRLQGLSCREQKNRRVDQCSLSMCISCGLLMPQSLPFLFTKRKMMNLCLQKPQSLKAEEMPLWEKQEHFTAADLFTLRTFRLSGDST